jgi:hypothetical protein
MKVGWAIYSLKLMNLIDEFFGSLAALGMTARGEAHKRTGVRDQGSGHAKHP